MYLNQPLQNYLDDLASVHPAPGGGSASALSGALAAALASMVARLTIGKDEYAPVRNEMEQLLQQLENLRNRFQQLVQEDIDAYGQLAESYKLPRNTEGERVARGSAIQAKLVKAALVPLEVAEHAAALAQHCRRIAEIGNLKLLSDIATAAMLASSAGGGAGWMVRVNLQSMKDLEQVNTMSERLSAALDSITTSSQQIPELMGARR